MQTKSLHVNKGRHVDDAVLHISGHAYDSGLHDEVFDKDAQTLFDLIVRTIPGGTYDRLCARLRLYWRDCGHENEAI